MDQQEIQVVPELQALLAQREPLDLRDHRVKPDRREQPGEPEEQVWGDQQVLPQPQVHQELLEIQDRQELQEQLAELVFQVPQEQQALQVPQVPPEIPD